MTLLWRERGVEIPTKLNRTGFGTEVIEKSAPHMLGGSLLDNESRWRRVQLALPDGAPRGSVENRIEDRGAPSRVSACRLLHILVDGLVFWSLNPDHGVLQPCGRHGYRAGGSAAPAVVASGRCVAGDTISGKDIGAPEVIRRAPRS